MNALTLKQLRYFRALAQHGHFGRAAEACAISQPAMSMQIRELEAQLGAALFERAGRTLSLTALGREFALRVGDILASVDQLGELARAAQTEFSGTLTLGVIPTVAPYLMPNLLGEIGTAFPRLELRLREAITPRLLDDLGAGRVDAAIVALPVSEPAFEEAELLTEPFVLVRPAAEAGAPVPAPGALRAHNLLLLEEGHCFRAQTLAFCSAPAARSAALMDGNSLTTLVQMVGAGLGITLLPAMAVPVEAGSARVAISRFPAPAPSRSIGMIWRRSSPLGPQMRALAEALRDAAGRRPA